MRATVHDSDGENAGFATLAHLGDLSSPELVDANPVNMDPGVLQEETAGAWHAMRYGPTPCDPPAPNQLGGNRRSVLAGDVGPAQSFTSVEDANVPDPPSAGGAVPDLPGRLPPVVITGEPGGFPT